MVKFSLPHPGLYLDPYLTWPLTSNLDLTFCLMVIWWTQLAITQHSCYHGLSLSHGFFFLTVSHFYCSCTSEPVTRQRDSIERQVEKVNLQVAPYDKTVTSCCIAKSPTLVIPPLFPLSLRTLRRMSSCLRNALKMRSTEHFPNSPQFTFSAFSLGCQAFVVIFINSSR